MRTFIKENKALQRFLLGQIIQRTSDWIDIIVLNWVMLHIFKDPMSIAWLNAARLLPQLLLSMITGKLVDCLKSNVLLYFTQSSIFICTIVIMLSFYTQNLLSIYIFVAVRAYFQSVDNVQRNKVLPYFVSQSYLKQIISLNALIINLTRIIGPFIGGLLLGLFDDYVLLLIPMLSSICVVLLNKTLPDNQCERTNQHQIMKYLKNHPLIVHIMISSILSMLFGFSFTILLPMIVKYSFQQSATMYALYTALIAAGSVIVLSMFIKSKRTCSIQTLLFWSVIFTISVVMLMVATHPYFVMISLFVMGFASQGFRTTHRVLVQQHTSEQYKGAVLAVTMMDRGFIPIGGVLLTYIYKTFGINVTYMTMLLGLVLMTLMCIYMLKEVRNNASYISGT